MIYSYFRAQLQDILLASERYNDEQHLILLKKAGNNHAHAAKCTNQMCKALIVGGDVCFAVDGAISTRVTVNESYARRFYFCAKKLCIIAPSPAWANIRMPNQFTLSGDIPPEQYNKIAEECNLILI